MPSCPACSVRVAPDEERLRRVQHDRRRRRGSRASGTTTVSTSPRVDRTEVEHDGEHHRLHRADRGDQQALQRGARFAASRVVERSRIERQRAIADAIEPVEDRRQRRDPSSRHAIRARRAAALIETRSTPGKRGQRALDQPRAARCSARRRSRASTSRRTVGEIAHHVTLDLGTSPCIACTRGSRRLRGAVRRR